MSEHTKEPLSVRPGEHDDWGFIRDADGHLFAVAKGGASELFDESFATAAERWTGPPIIAERARRIVACVNALAGIPTEALEAGLIGEVLAAVKEVLKLTDEGQEAWRNERDPTAGVFSPQSDEYKNLSALVAKLEARGS